jgi:anti-sigma B factor antagonist
MTAAQFRVENEPRYSLVHFSGFVDASVVEQARAALLRQIPQDCRHIILDLSAVEFLDSHGVGLFVSLLKRTHANKGRLYFAGADAQPAAVLKMVGFSNGDLVSYCATKEEAIQQAKA